MESEYVRVSRAVTMMGVGDGYFGMDRSVLVVGRARMSCTDRAAGRATMYRSAQQLGWHPPHAASGPETVARAYHRSGAVCQ